MSEKIKIRKVKKIELEICQKIIYDCIDFVRINRYLKKMLYYEYRLENIKKFWKEKGIYISEKNGFIIGTGMLDDSGEIRMIYVNPYFHNQEFGKTMVKRIETLAKRRFYRKVFLHALPSAKGFYKKVGFKKDKRLKNGTYYMEKRL